MHHLIMLDILLDLESMGTNADSAIVGIGCVNFDLTKGAIGDTFYRAVNLADATRRGCTMDAGAVAFWLSQTKAAQNAIMWSTYPLPDALREFAEFLDRCGPRDEIRLWGKGPSFDCAMLGHAHWLCELDKPWKYYNERCVRTISALYRHVERDAFVGEKHNAVDDAMADVKHLIKIREFVRSKAVRK